jgi:hypothetical protein
MTFVGIYPIVENFDVVKEFFWMRFVSVTVGVTAEQMEKLEKRILILYKSI